MNNPGTALVVNAGAEAYSAPNVMTLGSSGAVQRSFQAVDLSAENFGLSFYFQAGTAAAGRNIQLSLRSAASGNDSVFFLNLLGNRNGLQVGTNASVVTAYSYSSGLVAGDWYHFTAMSDSETELLAFSVTTANGTTSLASGSVDLSGTALTTQRLVFLSNASTAAGDWHLDQLELQVIPEPGTVGLAFGGLVLLALRRMRNRR